jgi:hypothetical protein
MDCATIRSDVIGDFQEPYGAVLVDGDDMAACLPTVLESGADAGAGGPAVAPIRRDGRWRYLADRRRGAASPTQAHQAAFRIIEIVEAVEEMHAGVDERAVTKSSHAGA